MLWIKAFHLIALTIWFGGLFYLPRLFVYHAQTDNPQMQERFGLMEKKLYYAVLHPGATATVIFGFILLYFHRATDLHAPWLHLKLTLVCLLLLYQFYLGHCYRSFRDKRNTRSAVFYRYLNELPTLFLIAIVLLVVLKPRLF